MESRGTVTMLERNKNVRHHTWRGIINFFVNLSLQREKCVYHYMIQIEFNDVLTWRSNRNNLFCLASTPLIIFTQIYNRFNVRSTHDAPLNIGWIKSMKCEWNKSMMWKIIEQVAELCLRILYHYYSKFGSDARGISNQVADVSISFIAITFAIMEFLQPLGG